MSNATSNGTQSGNRAACPVGQGALPPCGPFAVPFVVHQSPSAPRYSKTKALENGTLFQELDLPFHLKVNAPQLADTHLNQLRALDFVIQELSLYLDTHPNDSEAFALFQNYVELEKTAREKYVEQHGPLTQNDAALSSTYTWVNGPWPWQYPEEEECQRGGRESVPEFVKKKIIFTLSSFHLLFIPTKDSPAIL